MRANPINPFYAARIRSRSDRSGVIADAGHKTQTPVYARLPQAPRNASPVPSLTSLYHDSRPGPYGDRSYPGNCSGQLIKDLLSYFQPGTVYDPMSGSGTCKDVCDEVGIYCFSGDIHQGFDACEERFHEAFSFCWLHPPYWRMKLYAEDPRDLSREPTLDNFLKRLEQLLRASTRAVRPGGRLAVLMGDYTDREHGFMPLTFYTRLLAFRLGLRQGHTDIIRFSHGSSSSRKVYQSSFIPGLHDTCILFEKPASESGNGARDRDHR